VVVLEDKPTVATVGELISVWRRAPNVAEVAIDGAAAH
jgi:hypothetical protein